MASVRRQIEIDADADSVWDAIRDFGAVHERVVPGFVVDCRLDGDARIVTFFTGNVQREPLVDLDDRARRLVYGAVDSPLGATHYNASVQVWPKVSATVASSGSATCCPTGSPRRSASSWIAPPSRCERHSPARPCEQLPRRAAAGITGRA